MFRQTLIVLSTQTVLFDHPVFYRVFDFLNYTKYPMELCGYIFFLCRTMYVEPLKPAN
jgi:hypothetical protein